ncbi:hypothetical protein OGAPHI_007338 [Ogataea philodendri]|uniref:Uncharacterized protein n=1 Tax=Ogataea philodendri TaxID=1378263 RepID=A0A9P8NUJ7_9ASCO|nr:uncharacterized protein OGAPHI_007338 [Ogataea philodendri]KAH3660133.1 hypothetical protein OGAPHI_007338 [Ogataea philodendri]
MNQLHHTLTTALSRIFQVSKQHFELFLQPTATLVVFHQERVKNASGSLSNLCRSTGDHDPRNRFQNIVYFRQHDMFGYQCLDEPESDSLSHWFVQIRLDLFQNVADRSVLKQQTVPVSDHRAEELERVLTQLIVGAWDVLDDLQCCSGARSKLAINCF